MPTPARLAGVGVFVVGGLSLFAVGLFMIGDRQMAFAKKFTIYTEFKKITGLQPGGIIRVSGAKAGAIKTIAPPSTPGGKFRLELEITEDLHPLVRLDSMASIETEGLVGGSYLGVGTGTSTSPTAGPGATIGSKEPFEIAELMQQMADTIKKVNDTIDEMKGGLERTVASAADTFETANALMTEVSSDVKTMAANGVRISTDAAQIAETIRKGEGSLGKLVNDDELYRRATDVARQADEIATSARQVVEQAKNTLAGFQSKDGPVEGMAATIKQTMDDARTAMSGFAENMEALKHNFLLRGFFKDRGFFNLANISPADYRKGALSRDGARTSTRVWLKTAVLFEAAPDDLATERLTPDGKARLDSAMSVYLDRLTAGVLMIEGYAQRGSKNELYLRSRVRASLVRDYLITRFSLTPQTTGVMPLGRDSAGSPNGELWDGVALALFEEKASSQ
jgi:phospholipid/cholesterol/gamma-HCH transport system substrate-binding protein